MLREAFCKLTGYRYHYRASIAYQTKEKRLLCKVTTTILVTSPRFMEDHRAVKKEAAQLLIKRMDKHLLCNGVIAFEPVCYLGFFRSQK